MGLRVVASQASGAGRGQAAFCFEDAWCQFHGRSSGTRETVKAGILARTSASQACGSMSFIFAALCSKRTKRAAPDGEGVRC